MILEAKLKNFLTTLSRDVAIISKVGGVECLVLYLFFSVNPCLIDRFYF